MKECKKNGEKLLNDAFGGDKCMHLSDFTTVCLTNCLVCNVERKHVFEKGKFACQHCGWFFPDPEMSLIECKEAKFKPVKHKDGIIYLREEG